MSALYLAPRVPLIDVRTGCATAIFYRFLTDFFATNGAGATLDSNAFEILPTSQLDSLSALLPQALPDNLGPTSDVAALIANLQAQIDDLKKGTAL